jgi:hypothetical protein
MGLGRILTKSLTYSLINSANKLNKSADSVDFDINLQLTVFFREFCNRSGG